MECNLLLIEAAVVLAPPASHRGQDGLQWVHGDHEGVQGEKGQGCRPESFGLNQNSGHSGSHEIAERKCGEPNAYNYNVSTFFDDNFFSIIHLKS